jgi:hypothetical protein
LLINLLIMASITDAAKKAAAVQALNVDSQE